MELALGTRWIFMGNWQVSNDTAFSLWLGCLIGGGLSFIFMDVLKHSLRVWPRTLRRLLEDYADRRRIRVREFCLVPYVLPQNALPKMRRAWEFHNILCCGDLVTVTKSGPPAFVCVRCGRERSAVSVLRFENWFAGERIACERYYPEKRGTCEQIS